MSEVFLTTDENGEAVIDGQNINIYFNEVYHLQEVEEAEDYGKIGFDYLITLTNDMSLVDYGHFIYYFSDSMQIKNWPLEGLVVEKQVESSEKDDLDRYYNFRVSILKEDGTVDPDYNEKNGDDQFENGVVEFELKNGQQKMFRLRRERSTKSKKFSRMQTETNSPPLSPTIFSMKKEKSLNIKRRQLLPTAAS